MTCCVVSLVVKRINKCTVCGFCFSYFFKLSTFYILPFLLRPRTGSGMPTAFWKTMIIVNHEV